MANIATVLLVTVYAFFRQLQFVNIGCIHMQAHPAVFLLDFIRHKVLFKTIVARISFAASFFESISLR